MRIKKRLDHPDHMLGLIKEKQLIECTANIIRLFLTQKLDLCTTNITFIYGHVDDLSRNLITELHALIHEHCKTMRNIDDYDQLLVLCIDKLDDMRSHPSPQRSRFRLIHVEINPFSQLSRELRIEQAFIQALLTADSTPCSTTKATKK